MELSVSFVPNVMENCKGKFEKQAGIGWKKIQEERKGLYMKGIVGSHGKERKGLGKKLGWGRGV
jgi:hypothetical protein